MTDDDRFMLATSNAIRIFAREQVRSLAAKVRFDLRRYPPSGIFGDDHHRHLWDEYSLQVQYGPTALESSWEYTIQPHISQRIEALPQSVGVLLTIAAADEFEEQDGTSRNDALISAEVWEALKDLANQTPQEWNKG